MKQENNIFGLANKLRKDSSEDEEKQIKTNFKWLNYEFTDPSDIGNFNYGFTGRFVANVGFEKQTLNYTAGFLQTSKDLIIGIINWEQFKKGVDEFKELIPPEPPFGDEPDDFIGQIRVCILQNFIKIAHVPI